MGNPQHPHDPLLLSSALGYGLLCLGMAYVSSMLGPVLQVGVVAWPPPALAPTWCVVSARARGHF